MAAAAAEGLDTAEDSKEAADPEELGGNPKCIDRLGAPEEAITRS